MDLLLVPAMGVLQQEVVVLVDHHLDLEEDLEEIHMAAPLHLFSPAMEEVAVVVASLEVLQEALDTPEEEVDLALVAEEVVEIHMGVQLLLLSPVLKYQSSLVGRFPSKFRSPSPVKSVRT